MGEKTRRSNGEGAFAQRADGRIQGSIRINGKRIYAYGDTRQEAYNKLQVKIAEVRAGKPQPSKTTVREYLLKYLDARVDYKIGVRQSCSYVLKNQVIPTLGDISLASLCLDDMVALVAKWIARGLAAQTIRDYFSYFNTALNHAVKTKLIAANPCAGIKLPRIPKTHHRAILSREQISFLLDLFEGHWFRPIFIVFLATGLRKGELLALRWEDIDFNEGILHVRRNVTWIRGRGAVECTPKTESSERKIILQPFALDALRQHALDQDEQRWLAGEHWREHGLVFCRAWGDHIRENAPNHALTSRLKKANIPHMLVHGLRHTTATQLLSMRVNPKIVQELLGHASIQTTLDIYGGVLSGDHEQAMLELNDLYWGKSQGEATKSESDVVFIDLSRPQKTSMVVKMVVKTEDWIEGEWRELA